MLEHVANLLGADVEEVRQCFPDNRSLLPIDVPPPRALSPVFVLPAPSPPFIPGSPSGAYPGTELAEYNDPDFPSEPLSTSPSSLAGSSMIIVMADGVRYMDKEELDSPSPHIPLADITPIWQVSHPLGDTTDYEELAMVLYRQVSDQDAKIKELMEDKEN